MRPKALSSDSSSISPEQVAAFRLARHHLAKRVPKSGLSKVAGDMAGAQAQVLSAAQISLWARTEGIELRDVENALWRDRTLVKVWCMRGSLHLIPSVDFAVFVRGCTGREARSIAWLVRDGIPIDPLNRIVEATGAALDQPLTRTELAAKLSESFQTKTKKGLAGGWGGTADVKGFLVGRAVVSIHFLVFLACMRGLACFGPMRGNEATFVRPERWLPTWRDQSREDAETELLRRYLRAHGPVTVNDFAQWIYLTAAGAREVWNRLEDELTSVKVDGQVGWMLQEDLSSLQSGAFDRPCVRLLPFFDSFLLGQKDKGHLIGRANYKRVYRPQGWISPVVLVDGRVAGVWSHAREGRRLVVRIERFDAMSSPIRSRVREEAQDLGRFLDLPETKVTFTSG